MGILLALLSSVLYGIADFWGGMLSRRSPSTSIAFAGQLGGLLVCTLAALLVPAPDVSWTDLAWGALSGVGTGGGMLFLYRGLSRGDMSVVVPLLSVGGLALPVLVGVVLLGDRPSVIAWIGIALVVPALWLVAQARTSDGRARAAGTGDALLGSVFIAVQYLALAQAGTGSGIWPVAAGRVAAVITIAPVVLRAGGVHLGPRIWAKAGAVGATAAAALVSYLLATRLDLVSIAVVLSSLYPAIPVLLGIVVLRERLRMRQLVGLVAAGVAIVCLTF